MGGLVAGLVIGLGSGAVPGPLLVLAIATTLRRGPRSGLLVACGPLVSDALIIAVSLLVVTNLPGWLQTALGITGSLVVAIFGIETLRAARHVSVTELREETTGDRNVARLARHPLIQAAVLNLLNPAPWLFWFTAGASMLRDYWTGHAIVAVGFLTTFYVGLVGSKMAVVAGVSLGQRWLTTPTYRWVLIACGAALLVLALLLAARTIHDVLGS